MFPLYVWLQILCFSILLLICVKPCGIFLSQVLNPSARTFLDPLIKPLEQFTYRILNINPLEEQTWQQYLRSVAVFSAGSLILTMAFLFLQPWLPWNPQHLPSPSWDLILNTAISFITNSGWESFSAETTMSYCSQMVALCVQSFLSPAVSIAVSATITRALARNQARTIGYFWVDLIRICYYLLLPLCLIFATLFIAQGIPQNLIPPIEVHTIEGGAQTIAQGPVASREAIKLIGTTGGGFFNADSAHPYENPTPFCNLLQMLAMLLIPASQIYYFGLEVKEKRHAWSIFATLMLLFLGCAVLCVWAESASNPLLAKLGLYGGNMEGKEQRFGVAFSSLYAAATSDGSCGSTCSSFDSFTPLGGLMPMINMLFAESIFGGCGSGLYTMLIYVFVTVFFAGLIIGRTPEYFGKKIEIYEMKLTVLMLLTFSLTILSLTAWTLVEKWGLRGLGNAGPHGFSEIFYAYVSTAANNGSIFAGLSTDSPMYNIVLSLSMLVGRYGFLVPVLALAGSLAQKKKSPSTPNDMVFHGAVFTIFLLSIFLIFGALAFLPALALGPVLEQFLMVEQWLF
jgi:K+-transporting ATPase ATPase A chain